jgi:hypothetical protein
MTPKEKAIDLIDRLSECGEDNEMYIGTAKQCVLFAIDEIIEEAHQYKYGHPILVDNRIDYWIKVKQEIENQ